MGNTVRTLISNITSDPESIPHAWMGRSIKVIYNNIFFIDYMRILYIDPLSNITSLQAPLKDIDRMDTQIVADFPDPSPSPVHPMQSLNSPHPPPLHRGESTADLGNGPTLAAIASTAIDGDEGGVEGGIEEGAESEETTDDECAEVFQDNETVQITSEDECLMSPQTIKRQDSLFEDIMVGKTPEPMLQDSQEQYEKIDPTGPPEDPPQDPPPDPVKEELETKVWGSSRRDQKWQWRS